MMHRKNVRYAVLAVALLLAVFAPRPALAVMGTCTPLTLANTNTVVPTCSATVTTACIGGAVVASNRRHLEIDNGSSIDVTANFNAVPVSEQGYLVPAGQTRIVIEVSNNPACYGQPGTSTCTAIAPSAQLNLIAASATPVVDVCEW